jgi:hypothetical protein
VLAKRVEVYILDDDHLVAPFLVKDGTLKNCYRILLITSSKVSHGSGNTMWSLYQPLPLRYLA